MAGLLKTNDQWLRSKVGLDPRVSGREQPSMYSDQAGFFNSINEGLLDMLPMGGMTVYHGSPHKFNKFDMSKIGTGEGAAAYGRGLYFAENPGVAKSYADNLAAKYQGAGISREAHDNILKKHYKMTNEEYSDLMHYRVLDRQSGLSSGSEKKLKKLEKKIRPYEKALEDASAKANMYRVDLPDKHIEKMLDWDKPLDKQPAVMKVIKKHFKKAPKPFEDRYVDMNNRLFNPSNSTPHEFLSSFKSREQASQIMKDEGIPGIKYLDQGSRSSTTHGSGVVQRLYGSKKGGWVATPSNGRGSREFSSKEAGDRWIKEQDAQRTSNFVVFDDTLPTIEAINNVPVQGLMEGGKHSLLK